MIEVSLLCSGVRGFISRSKSPMTQLQRIHPAAKITPPSAQRNAFAESALREKTVLLYRNTPTGCISVVFAVAIVMLFLWSQTSRTLLIAWAIAEGLIATAAYLDYRRFIKLGFTSDAPKRKTVMAFVSAVAWGSAPLLMMPTALEYQVLLLLVICIIAFSGTVYFSYHIPAFYAFVLPLLGMAALSLLLQGGQVQIILSVGMIGMLVAVLRFGRNFNEALTRAINVSLENTALVAELTEQKETAIKANLAKTRFLASASHDLRQPMHTIGLLVALLRNRGGPPEQNNIIEKIHGATQAMENLFTGLLDISKLDAGMVKANVEDFAIVDVLEAARVNFAPQADANGLDLRFSSCSASVKSDAVILERIIANLVANAVRYTKRGKILVGCRRRKNAIDIQVWDTGIGIPAERQTEIFQEFFQLGNPERDRTKGLGLGLSIVKRSAELLSHQISVHSVPGKGSCFSVRVPRGAKPAAPDMTHSPDDSASHGVEVFNLFIVVIDDEHDIRFAMQSILEQWGCHVLSAASADEAIDQLRNHLRTPDLIISDYRLRENQNGILAVQAIRAALEENLPAIIITGDLAADELRQVTELDLPLAHKPISAELLRQLIIDTISRAVARDAGDD
jgi:two-component system, sensor histidine kinase